MRPTKANLERAETILIRNQMTPAVYHQLRDDMAQALDTAERKAVKRVREADRKESKNARSQH